MSELILRTDGQRHGGWKNARVRLGLQQMADSFEVSITEKWGEAKRRPIRTSQAFGLEIDGEPVITGHIDDVLPAYDSKSHELVVKGRSKTADLVDCSGTGQPIETARTVLQVARQLARPLDVEVVAEVDVGAPIRNLEIEPGQTYGEALAQVASYRALILVADALGRLVITRPPRGRLSTALVLGENIRRASGRFSDRDRFSDVIVQGQSVASDEVWGETASEPEGRAKDKAVGRYRPTLVVCDTGVDRSSCKQRADWEVRRRWGESRGVTYTVAGWRHAEGVWRPGYLVPVYDPWLNLDGVEWLITEVQLILDEQGERAEIRVAPPSSFDLQAQPELEQEEDAW